MKTKLILVCGAACLPMFVAQPVTAAAATTDKIQVLQTANGWVGLKLGADWKINRSTKAPQATAVFTQRNPVTTDNQLDAVITFSTFEKQLPEADARYNQLIKSIGGAKSTSGRWTVVRAGIRAGDQQYSSRTAYGDIADAHIIVTLRWFHLPKNDAQYDGQMEATFRAVLSSITGGIGKPR